MDRDQECCKVRTDPLGLDTRLHVMLLKQHHRTYLFRNRLWKSLRMVSLMKRFCTFGSPLVWFLNTTSSSHRLLTCSHAIVAQVLTSRVLHAEMSHVMHAAACSRSPHLQA